MLLTINDCLLLLQKEGLVLSYSIQTVGQNQIAGLSFDNRTIKPGEVFVCKGAAFRAQYLDLAIQAGAGLYLSETVWKEDFPYICVNDVRLAMAALAKAFYGEDTASLKKIGITGTKGKSTVASLLNAILDEYHMATSGLPTALISSIFVYDGTVREDAKLTTPEAFDLWRHLANAGKRELGFAVCEVSSQALKYHRTKGIDFDAAVFLNIGEDHISDVEHCDFNDYFSSKLSIFQSAKVAVVNSSADYYDTIVSVAKAAGCEVISFGFQLSDTLCCTAFSHTEQGTAFSARWKDGDVVSYEMALSGSYNVENALAALAVSNYFDVPYAYAKKGLVAAKAKGRGVHLSTKDKKITVIVDYAHNKMSMNALFSYVKEAFPNQKMVSVFGAPGQKAKNRRADMGLISGEFCDHVVITEDDPASEPLADICAEIATCVAKTGTKFDIIYQRELAIQKGFSLLEDGGVLLLCGKGAELAQKRKNGSEPYAGDEALAKKEIEIYDKNTMMLAL